MKYFMRTLAVLALAGTALVGAACQSTSSSSDSASNEAYFSSNGSLYHVVGGRGAPRVNHHHSKQQTQPCPECVAAGEKFLLTGNLETACKTCGTNRVVYKGPRH